MSTRAHFDTCELRTCVACDLFRLRKAADKRERKAWRNHVRARNRGYSRVYRAKHRT